MTKQEQAKAMVSYCENNSGCKNCPHYKLCNDTEYGYVIPDMSITEILEALNDKD